MRNRIFNPISYLLCLVFLFSACAQPTGLPTATPPQATPSMPVIQITHLLVSLTPTGPVPTQTLTPTPLPPSPTPLPPTATPVPTLPPLPQVTTLNKCPGLRTSILMPGRQGRVSDASPAANRIRLQPALLGEIVGEIAAGAYFDVLAGPQCADDMAWFEVRSEAGLQGWMAEGNQAGYWVMPILSDPEIVTGPQFILPAFTLTLPAEVGEEIQVINLPFDPETRTSPVTIARLVGYTLQGRQPSIYVYPLEDYLYYWPEGRGPLEQLRSAINRLVNTSRLQVSLANVVVSLSMEDVYWPQAGIFNGGIGVRAIAMLAPANSAISPQPYYAFWGFSPDMRYLVFAAFDTQLATDQPSQATLDDFQPPFSLLDQVFGFETVSSTPRTTIGDVSPNLVLLTADQVHTAFEIESAIQQATERGTHPGVVVLDGKKGIFKFDPQYGDDFSVNIAASNLTLRGVNNAVLRTDGISLDGDRMDNVTIEYLRLECPADCISSGGTSHRNIIFRYNQLVAGHFAIGISTPGNWWIQGNDIEAGDTAIMLHNARESRVFNNFIRANWAGIWLGRSTGANMIIDNTIQDVQQAGIILEAGTRDNQIQGNIVQCAPGYTCIGIEASDTTWSDNDISGNMP
jgi:parallel beta-helix repeat protein